VSVVNLDVWGPEVVDDQGKVQVFSKGARVAGASFTNKNGPRALAQLGAALSRARV
jgi:hypothetical protein